MCRDGVLSCTGARAASRRERTGDDGDDDDDDNDDDDHDDDNDGYDHDDDHNKNRLFQQSVKQRCVTVIRDFDVNDSGACVRHFSILLLNASANLMVANLIHLKIYWLVHSNI